MTQLRPMLADNEVIVTEEIYDQLQYPLVASTKLDGWRSYCSGGPRTRKGILIPNLHIRKILTDPMFEGLDGELLASSPTDPNAMQLAQSAFASIGGEPDFTWHIFDDWRRGAGHFWAYWRDRLEKRSDLPAFCKIIPQVYIENAKQLDEFVKWCTAAGYEGAIIRSLHSPYKHGRSTFKQGWMLKAKDYVYEEGIVVAFIEGTTNENEATLDDLGYTKRSSARKGMIPAGILGSILVKSSHGTFKIGTGKGMTADMKKRYWDDRALYVGQPVTFKHFAQSGVRNKPRHGKWVAFRSPEDLS